MSRRGLAVRSRARSARRRNPRAASARAAQLAASPLRHVVPRHATQAGKHDTRACGPKTRDHTMSDWNFDPLEISVLALVGALYWRRARTLAQRGTAGAVARASRRSPPVCCTLFVALASPIDTIGEERLFSVHMLQHLLLGDVGALLLVLGLDGRLLRPVLRVRLVHRLRVLAHPLVALPLWALNFVALAPARAVRRGTAERCDPRAPALALRRARDADVGGAARAAARDRPGSRLRGRSPTSSGCGS